MKGNRHLTEGHHKITLRHPSLSKRITPFSTAKCSIDTNHHENFLPLVSICWRIGEWDINNLLRALCSRELSLKQRNWLIQWSVAKRVWSSKYYSLTCNSKILQKYHFYFYFYNFTHSIALWVFKTSSITSLSCDFFCIL